MLKHVSIPLIQRTGMGVPLQCMLEPQAESKASSMPRANTILYLWCRAYALLSSASRQARMAQHVVAGGGPALVLPHRHCQVWRQCVHQHVHGCKSRVAPAHVLRQLRLVQPAVTRRWLPGLLCSSLASIAASHCASLCVPAESDI